MFAIRAKEKLISIEKKDREKKEKKILDRKKELQKFHEGLLPGDPRIGVVKRPSTAAKRTAKYVGTFSVQQNEPTLGKIKQIVSQQVSRIDFRQPPSLMPVALLVSVEGVKVLSEDGKHLIMAHALKRILFTMVHDKHTAFILVARNPDSPPDLCHCHIFMADSQIEAGDINELVGKAFKLAFANKTKQKDKKNKKESKPRESRAKLTSSDNSHNHTAQSIPLPNHTPEGVPAHFDSNLKSVELQQLKETVDRLDQELLKLNIENFDLESYFNTYQSDKGSDQYLKALATYEANRRVIAQKSVILERMHAQYHQLIDEHSRNDNLAANRNSNNVLIPPPIPKKKGPRSRSPSPVRDQEIPPPLPPKPRSTPDNSPPLIRAPHTNHSSSDIAPAVPSRDQPMPRPYEIPISSRDRTRTLTPADAPIPPGYEVWEPDLSGVASNHGCSKSNGNDFVLKDAEWFQSGIPREIAEEILRSEGEGSFIVRSSQSNPGCYALSMKAPRGNIMNFLIEENSQGVRFQGDDSHTFPNLVGLIVHHSVVPGILPCPLAVTKSNPLFAHDDEDNSSDEDPDYLTRSEVHKLFT